MIVQDNPHGAFSGTQEPPKRAPGGHQLPPGRLREAPRPFQGGPQEVPRPLKRPPGSPQNCPGSPQEAHRPHREAPQKPPDPPGRHPGGPRTLPGSPRAAPGGPPEATGCLLRSSREGPRRRLGPASHAASQHLLLPQGFVGDMLGFADSTSHFTGPPGELDPQWAGPAECAERLNI